jgi:hypothetical protein
LLVDDSYPKILDEAKINPLPLVHSKRSALAIQSKPLSHSPGTHRRARYYLALRKKYSLKAVPEKQIDEFIARMRRNYATAEPSDNRPLMAT